MVKRYLLCLAVTLSCSLQAQSVKQVLKIDALRNYMNEQKSACVINFWATWCKPCVQELPAFDSLATVQPNTSVILVCLDFKEDLNTKVIPLLKKKNIKVTCLLLDEVNGNDYINKISPHWSGAIPATLFKKGSKEQLVEKKLNLSALINELKTLNKEQ